MLKIDPKKITRAVLLALPVRDWKEEKVYDHIYLVPTGEKHDSGYGLIAIVGALHVKGTEPDKYSTPAMEECEIAAYCDDVCWSFPIRHPYDRIEEGKHRMMMRTDCMWPSRILRIWASGEAYFRGRFKVGTALSSTDVELVVEAREGKEEAFAASLQPRVVTHTTYRRSMTIENAERNPDLARQAIEAFNKPTKPDEPEKPS